MSARCALLLAGLALTCACVESGRPIDDSPLAGGDAAGVLTDGAATPLDAAAIGDATSPTDDAAAITDAAVTDADGRAADAVPLDAAGSLDAAPPVDAGPPPPPRSPGCTTGTGLSEGEHTFMLDGRARRYVVRLPRNYTQDRAWPLVLALHGNGGSSAYWDVTSGVRNIRGELRDDAILIIADAIEGNWRDYDQPPDTWPARIDAELAYFDAIITEARGALCLRDDALFAMGFSGGGSFAGVLACRRTDIRAIAVGGSVIYFDRAGCVGSAAAWITIGTMELTSDREAYRDFFRDRAGCLATSTATTPAPCVAYEGCAAATPVHYCQHAGGHEWPALGTAAMGAFFRAQLD